VREGSKRGRSVKKERRRQESEVGQGQALNKVKGMEGQSALDLGTARLGRGEQAILCSTDVSDRKQQQWQHNRAE